MKKFIYLILLFHSVNIYSQNEQELKAFTLKFLNDIKNENFESAYLNFDSTITKQFTLQQLKEVWTQIKSQFGELKNLNEPQISKMTGSTLFIYPLEFEKGALNAQVAVDYFNKITGFFLTVRPESVTYNIPDYADTSKIEEIYTSFGSPEYELDAVLTKPKNKKNLPVVILVHGSGPHDKDETIGPNKPFKDLALGLATNDIAVFRYDKRTHSYAWKIRPDSIDLYLEVIEDVIYATNYLKEKSNDYGISAQNIIVLGHSLGGSLIPRIDKNSKDIKAYISMAGMTRTVDQALIEQVFYIYNLDGVFDDKEKKDFEELKRKLLNALSQNLTLETPTDSLPMNLHPFYWLDFRSLYTFKEAENLKKPILVLQGESDYQVTMEDFEGWKTALKNNKNAQFKSYPKLNHLFMFSQFEKSSPQEYYRNGHISKEVILDIANWIKSLK